MKLRLIMPLLVIVAAFLFTDEVTGQTNGTFNNLTVRNQARIMGTTYIDTALYLRGLKPHIVAMNSQWVLLLDSVTENVYKIKLSSLADSVPIPAQYWTFVDAATDTLKNSVATGEIILLNAITKVPNRFTAYTNNTYFGYDAIDESVRQLGMWSGGGYAADSSAYVTVTHSDALSTVTGSAWNSYNSATISAQADSSSIGLVQLIAADKYFNLSTISVSSENITIDADEISELTGNVASVNGDSIAGIESDGGLLTCWENSLELYTNFYISISAADSVSIVSDKVTFSDMVYFGGDIVYGDTYWDDITFPASQIKLGATAKPDYDFDELSLLFPYSDSTEMIVANVQTPHRWSAGSGIYVHVHWIQSGANDTAEFILKYRWTDMGETQSASFTRIETTVCTYYTYVSGDLHQLAIFPVISGAGHTESSILDFKLFRKEDIGLNGDIEVKDFDIHYEIDKPGSDNQTP